MDENEFEFIGSLIAFRNSEHGHFPAIILAKNIDEANGIALRFNKETFPYKDGWHSHSQTVTKLEEVRSKLYKHGK